MCELNFNVKNQKLTNTGNFSGIVKRSKQYLKCKFITEGIDWNGSKMIAVFWNNKNSKYVVQVIAGECVVPDEVTKNTNFKMKLIGINGDIRIATNSILINQEV